MSEFPTILYRLGGSYPMTGGSYAILGVDDQAAFDAAIAAGWFRTLEAAMGGKAVREVLEAKVAVAEITPEGRVEMEAKARKLGVKFNARTTDGVLASRIAEAIQ
jgi:hypothetical protein